MRFADEAKRLNWWHVIELPDGTVTQGKCDYRTEEAKSRFLLPQDMSGRRVLDIGTFDGFWAIEAMKRGAEVLAADRWSPMLSTAKLALGAYGIPYRCIGDIDTEPTPDYLIGRYDIVLFYGVLYHLKNPWGGLLSAAQYLKPGGMLLLESAANQGKLAQFIGLDVPLIWAIDVVHHNDPSNYFMFNEQAIVQLGKMAGLEKVGPAIYSNDRQRIGIKFQKKEI